MGATAFGLTAARFGDEPAPFLSARRIAAVLGVNLSELAELAGVARNTLAAKAGGRKVDAALSPIVRILAMAGEMAGDEQRAAIWFKHRPVPAGPARRLRSRQRRQVRQGARLSGGRALRRRCLSVRRPVATLFVSALGTSAAFGRRRGIFGGRWSPRRVDDLRSRELSTAWAEYDQGFVQHPALIVRLELSGARSPISPHRNLAGLLGTGREHPPLRMARLCWTEGSSPTPHDLRSRLLETASTE